MKILKVLKVLKVLMQTLYYFSMPIFLLVGISFNLEPLIKAEGKLYNAGALAVLAWLTWGVLRDLYKMIRNPE